MRLEPSHQPPDREHPVAPPAVRESGFTLVELMIVVGIVAIIAAIAYPSYQDSVRKGNRGQARAALVTLMQQEERYMTQYNTYATFNQGTPGTLPFKANSSPDGSAQASHQLKAERCDAPSGGTQPAINECVKISAVPLKADPQVGTIWMDSAGRKGCSGTDSSRCWK